MAMFRGGKRLEATKKKWNNDPSLGNKDNERKSFETYCSFFRVFVIMGTMGYVQRDTGLLRSHSIYSKDFSRGSYYELKIWTIREP